MSVPFTDLEERLSYNEWQAWQRLCDQLDAVGIDINKHNDLCTAITDWGELYHIWTTHRDTGLLVVEVETE